MGKRRVCRQNVNAFYTFLHKYGQFGDYQFRGSLTESLTETFKYGSITLGDRGGWPNEYVTNPDVILPDEYRLNIWDKDKAYGNIRQINQFLVMKKKYSKFPKEKNEIWEAQARFFRAYIYFQLAKRHGGVILTLIWI
ncbi:RagB/SusD family nutrient uptake outer membrane protein [Bacteroides sp. BFG-637]|nr:RagB/SusD family nutrient uptake outer membrane protein [Bacteroides sp. BFG-637]